MFVSLDGVIEAPETWTYPYFNDEIGAHLGASYTTSDALLLGRVTYQTFAASFSSQTGGMADTMNNQTKYVVSTTLKTADWNNSTLIHENIPAEIAKLKQQPGKDITVTGSSTLIQTLVEHDLIDEYSLLVYPVVLGTGKRLFKDGIAKTTLKLIEAKPTSSGVVLLRYHPER
jgi:dihydrofolate reductase